MLYNAKLIFQLFNPEIHLLKDEILSSKPDFSLHDHPLTVHQHTIHSFDTPRHIGHSFHNHLDSSSEPWKPIVKPIVQKQEEGIFKSPSKYVGKYQRKRMIRTRKRMAFSPSQEVPVRAVAPMHSSKPYSYFRDNNVYYHYYY